MSIRVVVIDDSALVRRVIKEVLDRQPGIEVVGTAADPIIARQLIKDTNPDVLTLDVEMPRMDGLDFLERLMRLRPMPVVMVSSLTERGSEITLRALELGAVDFIPKPRLSVEEGLLEYAEVLSDKIRCAASARVKGGRKRPAAPMRATESVPVDAVLPLIKRRGARRAETVIAIGASTGGTEAIKDVLVRLPAQTPPILITQHMPEHFTRSFAMRLDSLCAVRVKEAEHGERIQPGHVYIAPGNQHLMLGRAASGFVTELNQATPVNRHRPSVDVLFRSVANCAGSAAVGVILTGMGRDGAVGLLEMRQSGAFTIAQDEESCVVFGMPREAIAIGAADEICSLDEVAGRILRHVG